MIVLFVQIENNVIAIDADSQFMDIFVVDDCFEDGKFGGFGVLEGAVVDLELFLEEVELCLD